MSKGDMLYKSDLLGADFLEQPEPNIPEDYLFRTENRFCEQFWLISEEMKQLNNLCVLFLKETSNRVSKLKRREDKLRTGEAKVETEIGDFTSETLMVLSDKIRRWEDNHNVVVRVNCLMLLWSFLERSLKGICSEGDDLQVSQGFFVKQTKGESKVDAYIRYLKDEHDLNFEQEQESVKIRTDCRELRNCFAHGDWSDVREKVDQIHLRNTFKSVSELLKKIELAYWKKWDGD